MNTNNRKNALKQRLLDQAAQRRNRHNEGLTEQPFGTKLAAKIDQKYCSFEHHEGLQQIQLLKDSAVALGIESTFFNQHQGIAGATSQIDGSEFINYSSYNYLGLSGDSRVINAAKTSLDQYGTSVSASRLVSGERPIHQQLENAIADCYGVDDAIVYVSGHAANVSTISYLFGPDDLIIHDEYIHNSSVMGAQLSGSKRLSFNHNNMDHLEQLLVQHRYNYQRVLIVVEGLYSMDGDSPNLQRLVELKQQFQTFLMVDEAHSFGTLGLTGLGLRQQANVAAKDVDIWMGTLSKALSSCGGYIAGSHALIENLKHLSPGFLYSVGMPAQVAAPALESLYILQKEPERVQRLQTISLYFMQQAKAKGFNTGHCQGIAIIPIITGSSIVAAQLSQALFAAKINVQPIMYPSVAEKSARLRFFISCQHTKEQIDHTMAVLVAAMDKLNA